MIGRRLAALGFVVWFAAAAAGCGSRRGTEVVPAPADPPAPAPSTPGEPPPEPRPPDQSQPPQPEPHAGECALVAEPGEPVATVGLGDAVDPDHAPHPENESERLLFRQLYETLVRVDCHGRVAPGLASSWRRDSDGRTWIVTLREDARFYDGTPVTWSHVDGAWPPDAKRIVESIAPIDERTAAVSLRHPSDAPLALAHADLAVARRIAGSRWPLGTRASRIVPDGTHAGNRELVLEREDASRVRFVIVPGDPRDLLDRDVDLLLTRDPAALDYAATLPRFQSAPLAWQSTRVLLTSSRSAPSMSEAARQALADDAVRGEARGAGGPFWWQTLPECEIARSPVRPAPPAPRLVYDANDAAARDVAERLVALDGARLTYQRATGLRDAAFARALRVGADAGYVVALDSRPLDPCAETLALAAAAPWADTAAIVPLVETRLRAIVRQGRSGAIAEWDGGVLLIDTQGRGH